MPDVHPTSTLGPDVHLDHDVVIGPHCSLTGRMEIGAGTEIMGHAYLRGPLTIGPANRFYPFVSVGFDPQDLKFDLNQDGAGLVIGEGNIFREQVTLHRATSDEVPTRIGDGNMFMVGAHVAHDASIGNRCILTNNVLIAGHARLADRVNIGGAGGVGQHCRVGRLAFIAGVVPMTVHVPPFMMARLRNRISGVNVVGLRRSGMDREEIKHVLWAFQVLYKQGNTRPYAREALERRASKSPALREIADFLDDADGSIGRLEPDWM